MVDTMKILTAEFIRSCVGPEQFPNGGLPEIAFVGRSNVGKSSLINSLLQRKSLAKVSRTPGKTRAVNVFSVVTGDVQLARFMIVDLPGYGYAKVSKSIRAQWGPLLEAYLTDREEVRIVVLLVESRVPAAQDRATIEWLLSIGHLPVVVATKVDKLKPSERVAGLRRLGAELGLDDRLPVIAYSSTTGEGRDRLWTVLKERTRI
ncbi:putative GTP-binding protein EngB [Nitrospira japonica]|uniref:Probable GTP-binding protein EngB n=2 Tax=Nitrospira japonica TaxID=1325564 RepID=A0A1W1I2A0_9BACT|nr:putative GTP-binding protein EngB [Nitrospira japonica]